jgi:ABC-2 type transport system permease protein
VVSPYLRLAGAQVRSQTQYRISFVTDLIASSSVTMIEVGTVFVLFSVHGNLGGFGGPEVLLMAALATLGFQLATLAVGNIDSLKLYVRTGRLDAVLVRPLSAMGQLLALDFTLRRIGRAVQGLVLYVVALCVAHIPWTLGRALLVVVAPLAGAVFFGSVFVGTATVAFWWIESGEMANAFTYGGRDFTSYPATMYGGWFRTVFAFGLGFAFVAYFPALALLGRADPTGTPGWLHWCSPLTALLAALLAFLLWRTGIRHYRSTGS